MKECTHCQGPLGLGVVRAFFRLFCSVRCRDAYRAALFERAKGQLGLLGLPNEFVRMTAHELMVRIAKRG